MAALVPLAFVTVTTTVAAAPIGEVAVIEVSELTVNPDAGVPPNATDSAVAKPVPVIVTVVPPVVGPHVGATPVTVATELS